MFPLYDSSPRYTFPWVNYGLIIMNIFVFYVQLTGGDFEQIVYSFGFIPVEFNLLDPITYIYVITSIFMHGGILHILSNLWFLHIFGDNVEDRMGHVKYLIFYLMAGLIATLVQYFTNPVSSIPLIGASGAISGVAGAYFIIFRHSSIKALVPLGIVLTTANLPVWLFLGYWFLIQLFSGFTTFDPAGQGGIAWYAHIGGFVFGVLVALLFRRKSPRRDIIFS